MSSLLSLLQEFFLVPVSTRCLRRRPSVRFRSAIQEQWELRTCRIYAVPSASTWLQTWTRCRYMSWIVYSNMSSMTNTVYIYTWSSITVGVAVCLCSVAAWKSICPIAPYSLSLQMKTPHLLEVRSRQSSARWKQTQTRMIIFTRSTTFHSHYVFPFYLQLF